MKLMQINAWHGRISRPLLELVSREQPDVIFTQEIFSYPKLIPPSSPWAHISILGRMASAAKLEHSYFSPSTTYDMFNHTLSYGNAIISRFPFLSTATHYTGGPGPVHFQEPGDVDHNRMRNFQHVVITAHGQSYHLINHHAHWAPQPLGDEISTQRLGIVAEYINELEGPVIMAGDLNLSPDSPALQQFTKRTHLRNVVTGSAITTTLSPAHYVDLPIICDYIFVSPQLTCGGAWASDAIVSDHRAVMAEVSS
jgi:endonuclease/exonuclease/phosphatase family metal-dependent hydrolase